VGLGREAQAEGVGPEGFLYDDDDESEDPGAALEAEAVPTTPLWAPSRGGCMLPEEEAPARAPPPPLRPPSAPAATFTGNRERPVLLLLGDVLVRVSAGAQSVL